MATTFSLMGVFLPVAFTERIIGRFLYQFVLSVAFAVLISLFIAFSLAPMMSSRMLKPEKSGHKDDFLKNGGTTLLGRIWHPIYKILNYWNVMFDAIKPVYEKLLAFSLNHRWLVIVAATVTFIGAIWMSSFLGSEFMTRPTRTAWRSMSRRLPALTWKRPRWC